MRPGGHDGNGVDRGPAAVLFFPLRHHFKQQFHVTHRLERYGATGRMEFEDSPPEAIAAAIAREIGREPENRPIATDGTARAAALIDSVR